MPKMHDIECEPITLAAACNGEVCEGTITVTGERATTSVTGTRNDQGGSSASSFMAIT